MRRFRVLFFVFTVLVTTAVAVTIWPQPAQAIVGGELDGNGHPNVGAYVLVNLRNPIPGWNGPLPNVCGTGTLIHPRVVLAAGHGTALVEEELAAGYYTLDDLKWSFGSDAKDPRSWLDIAAVITHPDYDPNLNNGGGAVPLADVGLVILKEPVRKIKPATLAPDGLLDFLDAVAAALRQHPIGTKFTVVGYGRYGDAPTQLFPPDGRRRVAQIGVLGRYWIARLFLDQNPAHGNGGTAGCDSGGPTFWVDPDTGREILVSLTSRGDAALVGTGVTYRVDTAEAREFIDLAIAMVEAGKL